MGVYNPQHHTSYQIPIAGHHFTQFSHPRAVFKENKDWTGPRPAARFCSIWKLCNFFISINYLRKYDYMGYPSVGDNCTKNFLRLH